MLIHGFLDSIPPHFEHLLWHTPLLYVQIVTFSQARQYLLLCGGIPFPLGYFGLGIISS
jgi:hypothetical protein